MNDAPETSQVPVDSTNVQTQPPVVPVPVPNPELALGDGNVEEEIQISRGSSRSLKIALSAFLGLLLLVSIGLGGFGVMVAYGKVNLQDEGLTQSIQKIVFSFPFVPKSAEYILQSSVLAHQEVSSAYVDASLATSSQSLMEILGSSHLDLAVEGGVDLSDTSNPKSSLNFKLTSQFDADLVALDDRFYFRVNMIPQVIKGYLMGMAQSDVSLDPLLNRWVTVESSKLDTDAREVLEENQMEDETFFDESYERLFDRILTDAIKPSIEVTSEELDGVVTHKLSLDLSGEDIDKISQIYADEMNKGKIPTLDNDEIKPSYVLKRIQVVLWIEEKTYYLTKATLIIKADNSAYVSSVQSPNAIYGPLPTLEPETIDLAFSLRLTDIGKTPQIVAPKVSTPLEDYMSEAMQLVSQVEVSEDEIEETTLGGI